MTNIISKYKGVLPFALFAMSFQTVCAQEAANNDTSKVNVAFRTMDQRDLLGGVSVIDMKGLVDKANTSNSLEFVDNVVGGFSGNIWGNDEYLVVIDGMVRDANNVLPSEIDHITLLKGASAVGLYGPRAAKGVVVITTKRGQEGDLRLTARVNTGFHTPKSYPKYVGSAEYMSLYNQALKNDGKAALYTDEQIYNYDSGKNPYRYPNFDMYSSDFLRKAYNRSEGIVEVTGGNSRIKYYTTGGYYRESSILKVGNTKDNYISRFFVRGNIDVKLNNILSAKADANVTFYDSKTANTDWWGNAKTLRPHMVSPLIPMSYIESDNTDNLATVMNSKYLQNGCFFGGSTDTPTNPYADAFAAGDSKFVSRQFQFNSEVDANLGFLTPGLMFRAKYGIDYASTYNQGYSKTYNTFTTTWADYDGRDVISSIVVNNKEESSGQQNISNSAYRYTYNVSTQFDYSRTFNADHNVFAMLVGNIWQTQQNGHYHRKTNVNLGLQLAYNYQHKYYVDFSAAMPYSTKLPTKKRAAISPTITLGARVLENQSIFDDLMVTASAGVINQDLDVKASDNEDGYYMWKPIMQTGGWYSWGDNGGLAATEFQRGENLDLTYVKRKEFTVGLRGSLLNKLVTFDFNFFTDKMDGGITRVNSHYPIYFTQVGYPTSSIIPYVNFNIDKRIGFDFAVNGHKKFGDVDVNLGLTGMWYKSTADKRDEVIAAGNEYTSAVGQHLDRVYGLKCLGIFQSQEEIDNYVNDKGEHVVQKFGDVRPGDLKYKDMNNDGLIDDNDRVTLGRYGASFIGGVNLTLKWKNFTFFGMGNLYLGGTGVKSSEYYWMKGNGKYSEEARYFWTPETAETAKYPRLTTTNGDNNYRTSDFWTYSTNQFKLRKVQLTYTFDEELFANSFVKGLDVFVAGDNLLTIAKERKILEMNVGSAPQTRYYSIGVKASF